MKFLLYILLYFFVAISPIHPQENEISANEVENTVPRYKGLVHPLKINYNFDELFTSTNFNEQSANETLSENPQQLWLRTELWLKNSNMYGSTNTENHFLSPLYKQYLEDSKFDPVRYVLGIAQLSAVGYLAYRHIEKYGFFK